MDALMWAVSVGQLDTAELLLEKGILMERTDKVLTVLPTRLVD